MTWLLSMIENFTKECGQMVKYYPQNHPWCWLSVCNAFTSHFDLWFWATTTVSPFPSEFPYENGALHASLLPLNMISISEVLSPISCGNFSLPLSSLLLSKVEAFLMRDIWVVWLKIETKHQTENQDNIWEQRDWQMISLQFVFLMELRAVIWYLSQLGRKIN